MPGFRVCRTDGKGRTQTRIELDLGDDQAAIDAAYLLYPQTPFELWSGARRVTVSAAPDRSSHFRL